MAAKFDIKEHEKRMREILTPKSTPRLGKPGEVLQKIRDRGNGNRRLLAPKPEVKL